MLQRLREKLKIPIETYYSYTDKEMKTLPKERRYETLSFLPPLNDQQIAKQIDHHDRPRLYSWCRV